VREYGWLDQRQFLIAVAIGMISPGPVVITAAFVGYLVAGLWGSLVSTVGIFLPSFILVDVADDRRRHQPPIPANGVRVLQALGLRAAAERNAAVVRRWGDDLLFLGH
jgi:hypothetical protein